MHHLENIGFYAVLMKLLAMSQMLREREKVWLISSVANSHNVHPTILFQIKDRKLEAGGIGAFEPLSAEIHPDPLSAPLLLLTHMKRSCFLKMSTPEMTQNSFYDAFIMNGKA